LEAAAIVAAMAENSAATVTSTVAFKRDLAAAMRGERYTYKTFCCARRGCALRRAVSDRERAKRRGAGSFAPCWESARSQSSPCSLLVSVTCSS
jgi:hypothetical protein